MKRVRLILCLVLGCVPLWFSTAQGAGTEVGVKALFGQISQARRQLDFRGVIRYWRGSEMSTLEVAHRYVNGEEQERLITRDGVAREILRRDDVLLCFLPGGQVLLQPDIPGMSFLAGLAEGADVSGTHYSVSRVGTESQAGHVVDKLMVMANDAYRYSHLLWLERDSGLLVKSMTVDAAGNPLERFEFVELSLRPRFDEAEFAGLDMLDKPSDRDAQRQTGGGSIDSAGTQAGWSVAWVPPGFVPLAAPGEVGIGYRGSVSFADGVAGFSVFVEPLQAGAMPEGSSRTGATGAVTRHLRQEGLVVTVVGEMPLVSAVKVADNVGLLKRAGP